ncbi:MAG: hypothetical protein KIT31_24920 [Deltaproteobacteria bacterium]|nr:hypothetical protein [Deltaproteobacteria bacterium]
MRTWIALAAALLAAGCKKEAAPGSPGAPASTVEQDALWELAPAGAQFGVVASARAVGMAEGAWLAIRELIADAPELAEAERTLSRELVATVGTKHPTLADLGLTSDRGFAAFHVEASDGIVLILPVADRDRFLAKVKGKRGDPGEKGDRIKDLTCRDVDGRYTCAQPAELLDKLGKGKLAGKLEEAGARGDIELAGTFPASDGKKGPRLAAVAQLAKGAVVVRGVFGGIPDEATEVLGKPVKPRVDGNRTVGFAVFDPRPLVEKYSRVRLGKVTLAEVGEALAGPITVAMPAGDPAIDLRVPLADPELFESLVANCRALPPLRRLGAQADEDGCSVEIPPLGIDVDAWVEKKELRIGRRKGGGRAGSSPMSAIGEELADGEWTFALFGHGTALAFDNPRFFDMLRKNAPQDALVGLRVMSALNEIGLAGRLKGDAIAFVASFRTLWANPDEVVKKLLRIDLDDVLDGAAAKKAKDIAAAHPDAPFAADHAAGANGVVAMTAPVGLLAATAIPAFLDTRKKSRKPEAVVQLQKIAAGAKAHFDAHAMFPIGTVGPSPAATCCTGAAGRCPLDAAAWSDRTWQALGFAMDEPHRFQYAYRSEDGNTYVATATGDLDCDTIAIEYKLYGSVDKSGHNVITRIEEPPPNSD